MHIGQTRRAELSPKLRILGADDRLILKHGIAKPSPQVAYFQLTYTGKRQHLFRVISRTQQRGGPGDGVVECVEKRSAQKFRYVISYPNIERGCM